MVIKSLTITEEAYDALKRVKYGSESFSKAILRVTRKKVNPLEKYFGILNLSQKEGKEWENALIKKRKEFDKEMKHRQEKFKEIVAVQ